MRENVVAEANEHAFLRHLWQYTYFTFDGLMCISTEQLPASFDFHQAIDALTRLIPDDATLISVALQEVEEDE